VPDRVGAGVEGQVDVGVDQAGQQRGAAQVGDVGVLGGGYPGADRDDDAAVDQDQRVADQGGAAPVEQGGGTECGKPASFGQYRCRHGLSVSRNPRHVIGGSTHLEYPFLPVLFLLCPRR
jgi:hypothetical protein